ncbi:MAG: hypothetical protein ABW136_07760 [Steroidobacteraceae bacterium]
MSRFRMGLLLMASATLAACGGDAPTEETAVATPGATRVPNDYTAAVSMGTDAAAARLQFQLQDRPVVGRPLSVKYKVSPVSPVQKIQVVFEAEPGIAFVDELRATMFVDGAASIAAADPHELQIIAASPGVRLLKATVMTETERGSKSTEFAIPLIVSEPGPAPAASAPGG